MKSLAIIALLIAGTSPALAQNAPPRDGYPPPAAGASGTPATYGPPAPGIIPVAAGPVYSRRGICLRLAAWNAGGIGVNQSAIIA
jgi:hypothetical protein